MPSKSEKQAKTMRAAAHSKEFAKKVGIPQDVAKEFVDADKKKAEEEKKQGKGKAKPSKESHTASSSLSYRYGREV
jgi:hypothetical protein